MSNTTANKITVEITSDLRITLERGSGNGRSVYCFVEKATGDILKAKGWKGPERKNPRGSIYAADPLAKCGPYGVAYLR